MAQTIQTQMNQMSQLNAHLTFAFLTGRYGRLRAELGADTFFAQDLITMAPTGGLSGQLWIAGPFAIEGAVFATPWPIWQLDMRAGLVIGIDSIGIRAGFRSQILEDRGVVGGTPDGTHRLHAAHERKLELPRRGARPLRWRWHRVLTRRLAFVKSRDAARHSRS